MSHSEHFALREIHPGTPEYAQAAEVRYESLYADWDLSRDLIADADGRTYRHVAAFDREQVIGYGRIWLQDGHSKIFQMVVIPSWRFSGVGTAIVEELVRMAVAAGREDVELDARDTAIGFYRALGFSVEGPEFLSGRTHTPHRVMRRRLR
ncbi:MAG: GNAT family N-acetyltransferase [Coriobacteriia bacterium]